jgi:hypothetical protein
VIDLDAIEARALAAGPPEGLESRREPSVDDFLAHAKEDVLRLLEAIREARPLPAAELDTIAARAEAAGPQPFELFLYAGRHDDNLIWVGGSQHDEEPDLYLWRGDDLAPDPDWVFIAHAREDIPQLVAAARAP